MQVSNLSRAIGISVALTLSGPAFAASPAETAMAEYDAVMTLTPNLVNGRNVYLTCVVCHGPEGWGTMDGNYPQIAGQLRTVVIKQLADIRARNRDNPLMYPFSVPSILGGPQNIADVAAYVAQLPMTPANGVGSGVDLELGQRLYADNCAKCHGRHGEGMEKDHGPLIAGQHYNYLIRQFDMIRSNRRKNANASMVKQIEGFSARDEAAVLDYTSRLRPPAEKVAEPGWTNPDFPQYFRGGGSGMPMSPQMPPPAMPPMPEPPAMPAMPERPAMPPMPEPPAMPAMPEPPTMPPMQRQ